MLATNGSGPTPTERQLATNLRSVPGWRPCRPVSNLPRKTSTATLVVCAVTVAFVTPALRADDESSAQPAKSETKAPAETENETIEADALTKAMQAIEARMDSARKHYLRAQYTKAVDALSGADKEIDALVAKHPQAVAKWLPSVQKALVYAILAESHKKQSAHYERLYNKGVGKALPMDEMLRIIERDKPQDVLELVPKKSLPANDADFPL